MSLAKHSLGCRCEILTMDPKKEQHIGKSSGSPKSVKSELSVSVDTRKQIEALLAANSRSAALKGEPIRIIDKEAFDELAEKLSQLIDSRAVHSVSPVELSTLNAELAQARLQLGLFRNEAEKASFVKKTLEVDVSRLKAQIAAEAKIRNEQVAASREREESARLELARLKNESGALKKQISAARTAKDDDLILSLQMQKQENADKITQINNLLQEINSLKSDNKKAIQKYQDQLLALTTELNFEKAKADSLKGHPMTMGQLARAAGGGAVDLYSTISKNLSSLSKSSLSHATEGDDKDVKNKVHWIVKSLNQTSHIVLKPYKLLFEGLLSDIKALDYHSRLQFLPIVDRMIRTLQGKENLTAAEIEKLLDEIDPSKLKMGHALRAMGIETWQQYVDSGRDIDSLLSSDLGDDVAEQARQAFLDREKKQAFKKKGLKGGVEKDSSPSKPKRKSFYQWCKSKVIWTVHSLQQKSTARPSGRASIRAAGWLKRKLGFFGSVLSLPIAFASFITGSYW